MASREMDMLHGRLYPSLLRFALPIALTAILEQLFNAADTMVLGRFVGTMAMAAVGNNTPIISLVVSLLLGLSLGANVVIAQNIGARRLKEATRTLHTALLFALLVGLAIAVLSQPLVPWMLHALAVPESVRADADIYLRLYLLGMPFLSLYNFASAIVRSRGDAETPLYALIVASLLNIVLDLVFVLPLGLGSAGAALGTAISYFVCALYLLVHMARADGILHFDWRLLRLRGDYLRQMLGIGLPAALQGMVFCIANLVLQAAINSLGAEVMAASAAAFTIEINMYCFIMGFQQAATTFVGQNYGAKNYARCREVTRDCVVLSTIAMLVLAVLIYFTMKPMLDLFSTNPYVIEQAAIRIYVVVLPEVLCVVMDMYSGALRGYGCSLLPALATLLSVCGIRLSWVYFYFPSHPTFFSLLLSYPLSWVAADILIYGIYRYYLAHLPVSAAPTKTSSR